jgi:hypothetical protein
MAVRIQLRRGSAAAWVAANPILADGELGLEVDTRFYKIGDGLTPWNALEYASLRSIDQATVIEMNEQATPAPPLAGKMLMYAKSLAGRMLPRITGPSGISTPLQPSLFQNAIVLFSPNTTTSISAVGHSATSVGTLSHPAATETYGYMTNFATANTAAATSGTGTSALAIFRGSTPGSNGFFFNARLALPDGSYDESGATTGSRIFVGLANTTMASSVGADSPSAAFIGFQRCHSNGSRLDTNWQFFTKEVGATVVDTGLVFTPGKTYDFYIFCAPQGGTVFWRIDNLTDGTTFEGSSSETLPLSITALRAGFQVQTVNAVVRNIRMQRMYIERDR